MFESINPSRFTVFVLTGLRAGPPRDAFFDFKRSTSGGSIVFMHVVRSLFARKCDLRVVLLFSYALVLGCAEKDTTNNCVALACFHTHDIDGVRDDGFGWQRHD